MGKKMKLIPSLFKNKDATQPWQWPSCKQPKTLSFRATDNMFKTVNSVFFDNTDEVETPNSWFTNSSESASFSTDQSEQDFDGESLEMVVRRVRSSERLFFEPGHTSSILEEAKSGRAGFPFKESVMLAMESDDPYVDFRRSMEEMVQCHGMKDWECLEELLRWYLRVNGKKNHGFIVGAFVDLLVDHLAAASSCSDSTSYSSAAASLSSSPESSLEDQNEIDQEEKTVLS